MVSCFQGLDAFDDLNHDEVIPLLANVNLNLNDSRFFLYIDNLPARSFLFRCNFSSRVFHPGILVDPF